MGDPTEIALIDLGARQGVVKDALEARCPRVGEVAFDSSRKRMTTINRMEDGSLRANVKGGLDEILSVCDRIETAEGVREITTSDIVDLQKRNETMAESALRVLAMAYRPMDEVSSEMEVVERNLIFVGMVGMIDPEREEVIGAIAECRSAGRSASSRKVTWPSPVLTSRSSTTLISMQMWTNIRSTPVSLPSRRNVS